MKKIFTIIALLALTLTAGAKDFTDQLAISLNGGEASTSDATISVEEVESSDGLYKIILKNFSFQGMKIGDVNIEDVKGNSTEGGNGYVYFEEITKEASITNGGTIAAMLGNKVTVTIKDGSCMNADKLYLVINLPVKMMGATINVDATFGTAPSKNTVKDFTDQLAISLNGGEPTISESTVSVEKIEGSDGLYNITLKDFSFDKLNLGDIKIENVRCYDDASSGYTWFERTTASITVNIGISIPVEVTIYEDSYMNGDKLYMNMAISAMGMDISAVFGTDDSSFTKSYTDNLVVTAMGGTMPAQQATIDVTKQINGQYTLVLKNFKLEGVMAVGTIEMTDVDAVEEDGVVKLSTKQTVIIRAGDDPDVTWSLENVPVDVELTGELTDEKLKANIDILYSIPGVTDMEINVKFGYESAGISAPVTNSGVEAVYDINGNKLNGMKKGLNILKKADGTTVKVIKK